jgi:hypothetical protein
MDLCRTPLNELKVPDLLSSVVVSKQGNGDMAVYGARFRQKFTLEDAIGSHACSLEALACV